jgi:DNA-directed RNA polymerase subunit alpha
MSNYQKAAELHKQIANIGLVEVLNVVFGKNISVSVPFTKNACNTSVDDLDFSVRASNSLKRAGVFTVGDIIDLIMGEEGLKKVRNLGKKTENEIKTKVLAFGYSRLTENEQKQFLIEMINRN